ncbi:MAG: glycosyltransferase family 2 protein [Oscillospiraceae bacterium]|nr:glycosyltransferase family 2 protein [Oscillospiraceae bacterium]
MDLISVVIPVYNAERTLEKCVESVLNQTYKNIQIILINDGSTDCSLNMCYSYMKKDNRVIVVDKQNGGVSSARNIGIQRATGSYLLFLDSDDWIENDMLSHCLELMVKNNTDVVISGLKGRELSTDICFPKIPPVNGYLKEELWNRICDNSEIYGYIGGKFFKTEIINKYFIRFNEEMYAQEDLDFCLSYYSRCNSFYLTDYVGYNYDYEQGRRIPPYCDFMRNQLKLLSITEEKFNIDSNAKNKIQTRICGYIYMMFYGADKKEKVFDACEKMDSVNGLKAYLLNCNLEGEKKIIINRYLNNKPSHIYYYFRIRQFVKKLLGRDKQ